MLCEGAHYFRTFVVLDNVLKSIDVFEASVKVRYSKTKVRMGWSTESAAKFHILESTFEGICRVIIPIRSEEKVVATDLKNST